MRAESASSSAVAGRDKRDKALHSSLHNALLMGKVGGWLNNKLKNRSFVLISLRTEIIHVLKYFKFSLFFIIFTRISGFAKFLKISKTAKANSACSESMVKIRLPVILNQTKPTKFSFVTSICLT